MSDIVSISFDYNGATYYALMRSKMNGGQTDYYITVMNGSLEMVLYGNHVFSWASGMFLDHTRDVQEEVASLRHCISSAISAHLNTSDVLVTAN